jgi:hypothetical protein
VSSATPDIVASRWDIIRSRNLAMAVVKHAEFFLPFSPSVQEANNHHGSREAQESRLICRAINALRGNRTEIALEKHNLRRLVTRNRSNSYRTKRRQYGTTHHSVPWLPTLCRPLGSDLRLTL